MMKESKNGRGFDAQNYQVSDGNHIYAVVDHLIYGDELFSGNLDYVESVLGAYGDECLFCRVRLFTLH
jgi:hypothetical protein